jgi:DNA-binding response OmpR family regulator
MTDTAIRVLQVEDSVEDAELVLLQLKKAHYQVSSVRVETADQLRDALGQPWDVIIADYHLPDFDAAAALQIVQRAGKDIPFIVVSGAIGEDVAVAMMKSGAHDYLMKDRLGRLASAVDREIRAAAIRKQNRQLAEERSAAFAELAAIHANAPALLFVVNSDLRVEKLNNLAATLSGGSVHELIGEDLREAVGCSHDPQSSGAEVQCSTCVIVNLTLDTLRNDAKHESIEVWKSIGIGSDSQERCYLFSIAPLISARNRKALICALDVTAHKKAR